MWPYDDEEAGKDKMTSQQAQSWFAGAGAGPGGVAAQKLQKPPQNPAQNYRVAPWMQQKQNQMVGSVAYNQKPMGNLNAYQGPALYLGPDKKWGQNFEGNNMLGGKQNATTWSTTGQNAKAAVTKQLGRYTTNRQGQTVDPLTGFVVQPPMTGAPGFQAPTTYAPQKPGAGDGSPWGNLPPWVQPPDTDPRKDPRTMAAMDIYDTRAKEAAGALDQRLMNMGLAGGVAGQALARQGREFGLGRADLLARLGESNRAYGLDVGRLGLAARGQQFGEGATGFDQQLAYQKFLADQDYRNRALSQARGGGYSMFLNT